MHQSGDNKGSSYIMKKTPVTEFMEKYCLPNFTQENRQEYDQIYQNFITSKYSIWPIENLPLGIISTLDEISQFNDLGKTIDTLETLEIEDPKSFEVDPRFESMIDQHIEHLTDIAYITGYTFENKYFADHALKDFRPEIVNRFEDESNGIIRNNPPRLEVDGWGLYLLVPATKEQQQRTIDTGTYIRPGTGDEFKGYLDRRSTQNRKYMHELSKDRIGGYWEPGMGASGESQSQEEQESNSKDTDTFDDDFLGGFLFRHFLGKK